MKLEYYSEFGGGHGSASFLGESVAEIASANSPLDVWTPHDLWAVAPPNAVEARISLLFNEVSSTAGAVYIDATKLDVISVIGGDYDNNGVVDGADLGEWRDDFGSAIIPGTGADGSADGRVDGRDFLIWQHQFGASRATPAHAVPEPHTLVLLGIVLLASAAQPIRRSGTGRPHASASPRVGSSPAAHTGILALHPARLRADN